MAKFIISLFLTLLLPGIAVAEEEFKVYWAPLGKDVAAFDSMMERAAFVDMPKRDLMSIASRLYVPANTRDPKQARARVSFWKGWVMVKDNPDSALKLAEEAIVLCDSTKYPYDHARFMLLKAEFLRHNGNFAEAYFIYRDKIERLKGFGDDFWTAKAMVSVAFIFQNLGEYYEAHRYFSNAQELFDKTGSLACSTKNRLNLANTSYLLGNQKEANDYLEGLETSKYVSNDSIYVANVLVSRWTILSPPDTAAARRAYEISQLVHDDNLTVISSSALGKRCFREGKYHESLALLRNAYAIAEKMTDYPNMKVILTGLKLNYKALGKSDSVSYYERAIQQINDSIYYRESIAQLKRAEHLSTINGYEQTLRQQQEKHRLRAILTMSVIGLLTVVLVLSLWLLHASKRKNASERRLQEEETRRLELLNHQYSLEIEAKEKEIASNTMILAQKNAKLKELAEQIRRMEQQGEIATPESRILNERISTELSNDDDWKYFKLRFDKVHPLFFSSLKEAWPTLSKTELRLCAYIRVGMSAKEIAQVLSVRPETVNTSRYRIRKKMRLDQHTSLESVLENY